MKTVLEIDDIIVGKTYAIKPDALSVCSTINSATEITITDINLSDANHWLSYYCTNKKGNKQTCNSCLQPKHLKELKTKKTFMRKITPMLKRLLNKDAQTLYKAEYVNGDLELTEKGKEVLMCILFDTHKANLVRLAEEEIAEKESKE